MDGALDAEIGAAAQQFVGNRWVPPDNGQTIDVYVLDGENRKFMSESNPWALHGMAERLLEAAGRGMWAQPEPATLDGLRQVLLETEGDLEG